VDGTITGIKSGLMWAALSEWRKDRLFRFAATPYQPVDAKANRKKRKAGTGDRTGCAMKGYWRSRSRRGLRQRWQ
jgi:hypothetical protein